MQLILIQSSPTGHYLLDLSLNALTKAHLPAIIKVLSEYPHMLVNLADNYLSWDDVKHAFRESGRLRCV